MEKEKRHITSGWAQAGSTVGKPTKVQWAKSREFKAITIL
jgi:hypothetical protein